MSCLEKHLKLKMWKNCKRALKEHALSFYPFCKGVYAPMKEVFLSVNPKVLHYTHLAIEDQGRRLQMEDRHFYLEEEKGILVGVLDGHNGVQVANYAAYRFLEQFFLLFEYFVHGFKN